MKAKELIKKLSLSPSDFERIRQAVKDAEMRTSGEIALAAVPESADYSFRELLAATLLGAVSFALLLPAHARIEALLNRAFWHVPAWAVTLVIGGLPFLLVAAFFLVANVPALDRKVIPAAEKTKAVYGRALRHFVESGVYATEGRTGILIFISYMEREVRVIADTGISKKIAQVEWDGIARTVAEGVKANKAADALCEAVADCGELLAQHFPVSEETPGNELPDGLVVLEAGA